MATRLTADELAELDRRAEIAGLSRSAYVKAQVLADERVCPSCAVAVAYLRTAAAAYERDIAALTAQHERQQAALRPEYERRVAALIAAGDPRLDVLREEHQRQLAALRGSVSLDAEHARLEAAMFYG